MRVFSLLSLSRRPSLSSRLPFVASDAERPPFRPPSNPPFSPRFPRLDSPPSGRYDSRIFEVERETKATAWEAFVVGARCDSPDRGSDGCVRVNLTNGCGVPAGWSMYSVERFYEAPLVSDVACADGAVTLTAHNVFKMNGWHVEPG